MTAGNFYVNDKSTGSVVGQQPFGGGRMSGMCSTEASFDIRNMNGVVDFSLQVQTTRLADLITVCVGRLRSPLRRPLCRYVMFHTHIWVTKCDASTKDNAIGCRRLIRCFNIID